MIYLIETVDHVFHADVIAYCHQNRYVRFAIYDLFTLSIQINFAKH